MADDQGVDLSSWLSDYVLHFLKSPTWISPIASFIDERCIFFDGASEENKLEYTQLHNEFKALIDDLFVAHLLEVEVTHEQFEYFCHNGLERNPGLHHVLVEQMLSVDDFLTFKAMMCKRNADLYSEAMHRLEKVEAAGTVPEGEATAEAAAALPSEPAQCSAESYDTAVQEQEIETDPAEQQTGESLAQEWKLYDDQTFQATEEQGVQPAVAQEEAELEQTVALSLQAEEERLRQLAAAEAAEAAALEAQAAALEAPAPEAPAVMEPPPPAAADPPPPAAGASGTVPQRKVLPKLVKVKKLKATTQLPPVAPPPGAIASAELERRQVQALQQRERAERVSAAPTPAASEVVLDTASPPPAAAPPPTDDERKKRAEHLRRTRELLVQKRNEERQRALGEYQATGGTAARVAAADRARMQGGGTQAGRAMADHLAGPSNSGPAVPVADAAKEMRQTLAAQLRQTLTATVPTGAADGALGRLEQLKP